MNTRRIIAFSLISCVIASLVLVYARYAWTGPQSYWRFTHRNQAYYAEVANECDTIVRELAGGLTNKCRVSGDDIRLPDALRKLRAKYVDVDSRRVYMFVDIAAYYGIAWERDEKDTDLWKLTAYGSEPGEVLFTNAE